jgi:hypothetical protein
MGSKPKKKPPHRPTKFSKEKEEIAIAMYELGATDKQVAKALKVTEQTVNNWKIKHPSFFESLKEGKLYKDGEVETSLLKRAKGFVRRVERIDKFNNVVVLKEEVPPDPTSMIFWLKNRKPKEWRDKQELEHSGEVGVTLSIGQYKPKL